MTTCSAHPLGKSWGSSMQATSRKRFVRGLSFSWVPASDQRLISDLFRVRVAVRYRRCGRRSALAGRGLAGFRDTLSVLSIEIATRCSRVKPKFVTRSDSIGSQRRHFLLPFFPARPSLGFTSDCLGCRRDDRTTCFCQAQVSDRSLVCCRVLTSDAVFVSHALN